MSRRIRRKAVPPIGVVRMWHEAACKADYSDDVLSNIRRHFLKFVEWLMEEHGFALSAADPPAILTPENFEGDAAEHLQSLILDEDGYWIRKYVQYRKTKVSQGTVTTECSSMRVALEFFRQKGLSTFNPARFDTPRKDGPLKLDLIELWLLSTASTSTLAIQRRNVVKRFLEFLLSELQLTFDAMKELEAYWALKRTVAEEGLKAAEKCPELTDTLTGVLCFDVVEHASAYGSSLDMEEAKKALSILRNFYRWLGEVQGWTEIRDEDIVNPHSTIASRRRLANRSRKPFAEEAPAELELPSAGRRIQRIESVLGRAQEIVRERIKKLPAELPKKRRKAKKAVKPARVLSKRRMLLKLSAATEVRITRDRFITEMLRNRGLNLEFSDLCQLRIVDYAFDDGVLIVREDKVVNLRTAPQGLLKRYSELVTREPLVKIWEEKMDEAPLLLSLDGGSLVPDDNEGSAELKPGFFVSRSKVITRLVREEDLPFHVVSGLNCVDLVESQQVLDLRKFGLKRFQIKAKTAQAIRDWSQWVQETEFGLAWKNAINRLPLLIAADGASLTADETQ